MSAAGGNREREGTRRDASGKVMTATPRRCPFATEWRTDCSNGQFGRMRKWARRTSARADRGERGRRRQRKGMVGGEEDDHAYAAMRLLETRKATPTDLNPDVLWGCRADSSHSCSSLRLLSASHCCMKRHAHAHGHDGRTWAFLLQPTITQGGRAGPVE